MIHGRIAYLYIGTILVPAMLVFLKTVFGSNSFVHSLLWDTFRHVTRRTTTVLVVDLARRHGVRTRSFVREGLGDDDGLELRLDVTWGRPERGRSRFVLDRAGFL